MNGKISNTRANKKGSSFRNLFGKRLDTIQGHREDISITLFVDIIDGISIESKSDGPFKVSVPQLSLKDTTNLWFLHYWRINSLCYQYRRLVKSRYTRFTPIYSFTNHFNKTSINTKMLLCSIEPIVVSHFLCSLVDSFLHTFCFDYF